MRVGRLGPGYRQCRFLRGLGPISKSPGRDKSRKRKIRMISDMPLVSKRFPRAAKYNPDWVLASVSGAANPLWLSEWLAAAMDLRPGMRVLDLGCGRGAASI